MRIKSWFEFVKTVQEIAKAVPKNELHNDSFWVACKEKLCSLSLTVGTTGYNLIDSDIANQIIKEYQESK